MFFEILCLDSAEKVVSRTVKTLLFALLANDNFFNSPEIDEAKGKICDDRNLQLQITQFPTDKMLTGVRYTVAFKLSVECDDVSILDKFRISLVDYVKSIGFSNVRILLDEVSAHFAASIYPKLYALENQVRTFIINFFLKNLGTNWTMLVMAGDTLEKIKKRKKNDRIFADTNRVDSDASLIDFDDLGKILYGENSILSSKKADNVTILIEKISCATNLEDLKREVLEGNFYKYFKDCFTQKDFQNKWLCLSYYRNKIAHNGSFSQEEADDCSNLCGNISAIIDSAYEKLDTFRLSTSDQEALMVVASEIASETQNSENSNEHRYKSVTEEVLLHELKKADEDWPFIGLRHFVVDWLGSQGFDYDSAFTLINYLEDKQVIKLNKVVIPGTEYPTTTIVLNEKTIAF